MTTVVSIESDTLTLKTGTLTESLTGYLPVRLLSGVRVPGELVIFPENFPSLPNGSIA
jgi:hypothetical protein